MPYFEHDDALRSQTRRARIVKVDDSGPQQLVDLKGLKNEEPKKIYRPMDFGFFSVPPQDTEGVMIQMGGRSDRTLYLDGGHPQYRPKKRPAGSSGLFDQYGNLIQSDKNGLGVTHSSKINLQLGKGYDAKGASDYNGPAVSIVLQGSALTLTMGGSSIKMEDGKITIAAQEIVLKSPNVNLGAEGGTLIGLCGDGCATTVKAV